MKRVFAALVATTLVAGCSDSGDSSESAKGSRPTTTATETPAASTSETAATPAPAAAETPAATQESTAAPAEITPSQTDSSALTPESTTPVATETAAAPTPVEGPTQEQLDAFVQQMRGAIDASSDPAAAEQAITGIVNSANEPTVIKFLSSGFNELDESVRKRAAYLTAKSAYSRFGSAQTQFYYALFTQRGLGVPKSNEEALAILGQPASGTTRDSLWLRAEIMMAAPDADQKKDQIRQLLEEAAEMGSGEAMKLLEGL